MQGHYAEAAARGTRVVQFNMPAELWRERELTAVSTVGYDNALQAGFLAGDYIARRLPRPARLALVWGLPGHWSTARSNGLKLALRRHPNLQLVAISRGDYEREGGMEAARQQLQRHRGIDAIYAENEEMALGVSQAIDDLGLSHWDGRAGILTVGADGTKSGYERIKAGGLTATIDVNAVEQGRSAIAAVFRSVATDAAPRIITVPTSIVDARNIDDRLAAVPGALTGAEHSG
jgi:ribose transport system substrate-binding protein